MISYLLLAASILLAVCKSALYNAYAKHNELTWHALFRFNAISYGVATAIACIGAILAAQLPSAVTVVCAFFYAAIVISLQTVSISAMHAGAMSVTSMFVMYGMIIPAVAGPLFWHEPIGALQIAGICLMLLSLWLLREKAPQGASATEKKWIVPALVAFLLSGMAGVMEKIHQSTGAKAERLPFVLVACAFMFAFSLGAIWIKRKPMQAGAEPVGAARSSASMLAALSGMVIGVYSTVNLILSGRLDSMIYYPVANGGALLLTVLVSVLLFRERPSRRSGIGFVIGLAGILCLSIPI